MSEHLDAARWRALLSSGRIRIVGSAGFDHVTHTEPRVGAGHLHFGVEFWSTHSSRDGSDHAKTLLTNYADWRLRHQDVPGDDLARDHDARVTELLQANSREVGRRRLAETRVDILTKALRAHAICARYQRFAGDEYRIVGYFCENCNSSWDNGETEVHTPMCAFEGASDAKSCA